MTPLQRTRRLQTGLASLGIVGAAGASLGIGSATHAATHSDASGTHASATDQSSQPSQPSRPSRHHPPSIPVAASTSNANGASRTLNAERARAGRGGIAYD
jgi:hypothetical protein